MAIEEWLSLEIDESFILQARHFVNYLFAKSTKQTRDPLKGENRGRSRSQPVLKVVSQIVETGEVESGTGNLCHSYFAKFAAEAPKGGKSYKLDMVR